MNIKRISALVRSLVMVLCMLAGCGGEPSGSGASAPAAETNSSAGTVTTPAPAPEIKVPDASNVESAQESAAPEYQKVDYGYPLFEDTVELSMFYCLRQGGGMPSKADGGQPFWTDLEDRLNVKLEWIEPGEASVAEQYNLLCVSGALPDIVFQGMINMNGPAYSGGYDKAIEDEIYFDMYDMLEEYAPNYWYYLNTVDGFYRDTVTDGGAIYGFSTLFTEQSPTTMGLLVNGEYLEATGLELPDTVPGWMEVFSAMKSNGVTAPCAVNSTGALLNGAFSDALGGGATHTFLVDAETHEIVYDGISKQSREYIQLFRELWSQGCIDKDFLSVVGIDASPFLNGTTGTWSGMNQDLDSWETRYPDLTVTPCPVIRMEGGGSGQVAIADEFVAMTDDRGGELVITTNCDDVESAMRFCDWFYSDEGYLHSNYGWDQGVNYDMVDDKPVFTEMMNSRSESGYGYVSIYTNDNDFGLVDTWRRESQWTELSRSAVELWSAEDSSAAIYYNLPLSVSLSLEEQETLPNSPADLETYVTSQVIKWCVCEDDFNDAAWNAYVDTVYQMGLEEMLEAYNRAYQAYLAKG